MRSECHYSMPSARLRSTILSGDCRRLRAYVAAGREIPVLARFPTTSHTVCEIVLSLGHSHPSSNFRLVFAQTKSKSIKRFVFPYEPAAYTYLRSSQQEIDEQVYEWTPESVGAPPTHLCGYNFTGLAGNEKLSKCDRVRKHGVGSCGRPEFYGTIGASVRSQFPAAMNGLFYRRSRGP